ncbi:DUF6777 domain-containing protein [Streptomyces sp. NPDC006923]|uniref:DUF6777 domain-containing protein n=1 Tax=Streptomyces sp. NPDC006923 TaxID=3155355 RepID=UPI0033FD0B65
MRSPIRRRYAAFAALSAGVLITAGCGRGDGAGGASGVKELFLQSAGARGPDPFTPSTVAAAAGDKPSPRPSAPGARPDNTIPRTPRALPGSTPGLYGGVPSLASCDVERQVRFLTEDRAKARAFAQGAGIGRGSVPSFLRDLTPVFLRADTRVTAHGYRDGSATAFQSVLQSGTAVMVDDHGLPRVRCAAGNPLRPPVAAQGSVVHRGEPWPDYKPDRVIVINRTAQAVDSLTIVNSLDNTWIERSIGADGDEDSAPNVPPPYDADADITDPDAVTPPTEAAASGAPSVSSVPTSPTRSAPDSVTGTGPGNGTGAGRGAASDCPTPKILPPGEISNETLTIPPGCPMPSDSPFDSDAAPLPLVVDPGTRAKDRPLAGPTPSLR